MISDKFSYQERWLKQAEKEIGDLKVEAMKLRDALKFYADPENRSACLIDQYEFTEKYFKKEYICDVMDTEYLKDNGEIAKQALHKNGNS